MSDADLLDKIKFDLLTEGAEDYLGLWEVLWEVHETLRIKDVDGARTKTLEIIGEYLKEGLIVPGFPIDNGPNFAAWELSPDEAMAIIIQEWCQLPREPVTGDIIWFITTNKGKEWLQRRRALDPRNRSENDELKNSSS